MSVEEKIAQLSSVWLGRAEAGVVAPEMDSAADSAPEFADVAAHGLGQLTRIFGTKPVLPAKGLATLLGYQRWVRENASVPIGVLAHEECLTGLSSWTATTFPTPLAWAASFDPGLVREMGQAIGTTMGRLGVRQGLAPVLDVVRDARWGRVEETLGEDPYVVATLGKSYIEGLQSTGVIATAKHFTGYSGSYGGRNLAPVHAGPREIEDVFLFPFEVAVLDARVGSVMPSYVDIDGVPAHSDRHLLTDVLRERWGFSGTVVADYFGIAFLDTQHHVAANPGDAATSALLAGVDVELPSVDAFRDPAFAQICQTPHVALALDEAVTRVLAQKEALGLLDIDAEIARLEALLESAPANLDPHEHRHVAARMAEESVILLANDGALPLASHGTPRLAVVGPNADRAPALFGCYSFVNHVLANHPSVAPGIEAPTILEAIRAEFPDSSVEYAAGASVSDPDRAGFDEAVAAATHADAVIAVMGDQAGLFGRGTSGEGCDADSLDLPGVQDELVDALIATGVPVILVSVTGRPYALGRYAGRAAAVVQAFFPGEEGAAAVAGVLSGRVNPSGRLPMSVPRSSGAAPYSYLHPQLGEANRVSSIDPTPEFPFGFGLSYTSFDVREFSAPGEAPTNGWIPVSVTVANTGSRPGATVVQVYGRDLVASVTRPVRQLLAYARVSLDPGESTVVRMEIPSARFAFHDRQMVRVVEPGAVLLWVGWDCEHPATDAHEVLLTGDLALVDNDTPRLAQVSVPD